MNKSKEDLDLPTTGKIYMCPGMLQKFHPDFDEVFKKILEKDKTGYIVLFDDNFYARKEELEARLKHSLGDVFDRVHFRAWADGDDFKRCILFADVILETLHFGSGNTAMLCLGLNQPIVTWPGEFMRGRTVKSVYDIAQMEAPVANSLDEYVDMAIRMAHDEAYHQKMKEEIRQKKHKLYGKTGAGDEIYEWFKEVTKEKISQAA